MQYIYDIRISIFSLIKNTIIVVQLVMSLNNQMRFGLQIVFVCLHITASRYHQCAN